MLKDVCFRSLYSVGVFSRHLQFISVHEVFIYGVLENMKHKMKTGMCE